MTWNDFKGAVGKHAPEILLVLGIGEIVATVVVAVKASAKAKDELQLAEMEYENEHDGEELPVKEVVKTVAPTYIPTGIMLIGTITTIIMSHYILTKRNAALAVMLSVAQNTAAAYQDQILEKFGPKKLAQVQDEIVKKQAQDNPPPEEMVDMNIPSTDGLMLCYDKLSDRYFRSNEDVIRRAFNRTLNPKLNTEMELTCNEYWDEIGLKQLPFGNDIVWKSDCKEVEPRFVYDSYCGQPLCIVDFWIRPSGPKYRWG